MCAVFVSCSNADQVLGGSIVHGLRRAGIEVWWREEMPGVDWGRALEGQMAELGAVVALWTATSRDDPAVKEAARLGLAAGKLANALCGAVTPPFPYGSVDGATLDGWDGGEGHPGWMRLVELVKTRVATMTVAATDPPPRATDPPRVEAVAGSGGARAPGGAVEGSAEAKVRQCCLASAAPGVQWNRMAGGPAYPGLRPRRLGRDDRQGPVSHLLLDQQPQCPARVRLGGVMIPWAMFAGAYALWKRY